MGRSPRQRPRRLAAKLLQVRQALEYSQGQMLTALGLDEKVYPSAISGYELGTREPPLLVLLKYARLAGVVMDVLVDDHMDLPTRLPRTSRLTRKARKT
jgi:transcriptional regulator with XRE-family HTH domain